jgi:hypothetical protein
VKCWGCRGRFICYSMRWSSLDKVEARLAVCCGSFDFSEAFRGLEVGLHVL